MVAVAPAIGALGVHAEPLGAVRALHSNGRHGLASLSPRPGGIGATRHWPKPNIRVTRGKLRGQHFAEWAEGEEKAAELTGLE